MNDSPEISPDLQEIVALRQQLAVVSRERDIARLAYMILTGTYKPGEQQLAPTRLRMLQNG